MSDEPANPGADTLHQPCQQPRRLEVVLLAIVLVAAYPAVSEWILNFLPKYDLYNRLGVLGYLTLLDALTLPMPLLLCLGCPRRSGLRLGEWTSRWRRVAVICLLPVVLTAVICPFTDQPFKGDRIGMWLVSPAAQELMFTGYLYGLLAITFPGAIRLPGFRGRRFAIPRAIPLTAAFFALWHVPNFAEVHAGFVVFQLVYTFLGGAWMLLARKLTGSILPGVATHMAVNFISWMGW